MLETLLSYAGPALKYAALALAAAVAALAVIAPATATEKDNKALAFLQRLLGYVDAAIRALFPKALLPAARVTLPPGEAPEPKRDHR